MADVPLSAVKGGGFRTTFFSGPLQIASGVAGNILTLTAPTGKRVRLVSLVQAVSGAGQVGVSVLVDGNTVVNSMELQGTASKLAGFVLGQAITPVSTSGGLGATVLLYVEGSVITVNKSGGATTQEINYSYEFGD
jgi:hypothetical protein